MSIKEEERIVAFLPFLRLNIVGRDTNERRSKKTVGAQERR